MSLFGMCVRACLFPGGRIGVKIGSIFSFSHLCLIRAMILFAVC